MKSFAIRDAESSIELVLSIAAGAPVPNVGDVDVTARVSSFGFGGSCTCTVFAAELTAFLLAVQALASSGSGSASLFSMSPGELTLTLEPANGRGYLLASGSVGRHVVAENGVVWHSTTFGFTVEPQQVLDTACAVLRSGA
jgi:hypothetical protein